ARSCEAVPDQELERAVEPDLGRRLAALDERRPEADEAPVAVGFGARDRFALEDRHRIGGQFAGEDGGLDLPVETMAADRLAPLGHADDRWQCLAPLPDFGLARRADRSE